MTRTGALVLANGLAVALTSPAWSADPPVRSVTMHRSGVASVERSGQITGDEVLTLTFASDQINDVLKSLVVVDAGGGRIEGLSYAAREPLSRRLEGFALDLGDNPSIADLIDRLRGESVRLETAEGATIGKVLGVEHRKEADGEVLVDVSYARLVSQQGLIRMVRLADLRGMELLDPALAEELGRALAALASGRNERTTDVALSLRGDGTRRVTLGYVQEAPVWKTSYRLVLPEDGGDSAGVYVQGWAIVENTTDEDWQDIRLSLVAGRPVGFTMDLATPVFVPRPEMPVPVLAGVMPRTYEDGLGVAKGLARAPSPAAADMADERAFAGRGAMLESSAPEVWEQSISGAGIAGGVVAAAEGVDAGRVFSFDLAQPVSIPRRGSAMLPILGETIEGRVLSVFNPADGGAHPMRAIEIENTAGTPLMAGPVAVYDGGTYAGDAPLDYLPAGGSRLLGYAVDLEVRVHAEASRRQRVESIRIVDGVMERTSRMTDERSYTIDNADAAEARTVLIEHPRLEGWDLAGDAEPAETTPALYRFEVRVEPGESATLRVAQERTSTQALAVLDADVDELAALVREGRVSDGVLAAVREAGRLQASVREAQQRLAALEREEQEIFRDQDRLRQNLSRVERGGDLHARYLRTLDEQESRLVEIRDGTERARADIAEREGALREHLRNLDVRG